MEPNVAKQIRINNKPRKYVPDMFCLEASANLAVGI